MRFPRRFAPRNDTGGRHSQARRCAPPNGKGPQVCHCEPCGARRGNLAVPAGARESPGEVEGAYLRLPRRACALLAMTREGGDCKLANAPLRMGKAPKFVIASLAEQGAAISQDAAETQKGLRRIRYCLPEIAASAFGLLAMTRVGGARKFVPASLRKRQVPRLVIARLRRSRGAGLPAGKGREPSPYQRRFLHFPSFPHFLQDVKRFRHGAQIMGPLFGGSMHCGARQDMLQFMVLR